MPPSTRSTARSGASGRGRGRRRAAIPGASARSVRSSARPETPSPAARSPARSEGARASGTAAQALQTELAALKADLHTAQGTVQQLEASRAGRADGDGAEEPSGGLPAEGAHPAAFLDFTRPSVSGASGAHVKNASANYMVRAWHTRSVVKGWILLGERPTMAGCDLDVEEMQALFHDVAQVTPRNHEQLNSMIGFGVRGFISRGDSPTITKTSLSDHLGHGRQHHHGALRNRDHLGGRCRALGDSFTTRSRAGHRCFADTASGFAAR